MHFGSKAAKDVYSCHSGSRDSCPDSLLTPETAEDGEEENEIET